MTVIYQVWGEHGDHDEYERNLLGTYADKALANEHVRLANERLQELMPRYYNWTERIRQAEAWKPFRGQSVYDPFLASTYGLKQDMRYSVARETVRTTVPGGNAKQK